MDRGLDPGASDWSSRCNVAALIPQLRDRVQKLRGTLNSRWRRWAVSRDPVTGTCARAWAAQLRPPRKNSAPSPPCCRDPYKAAPPTAWWESLWFRGLCSRGPQPPAGGLLGSGTHSRRWVAGEQANEASSAAPHARVTAWTPPPPHLRSVEKLSSMKPVPGAKKGWGPLLQSMSSHLSILWSKNKVPLCFWTELGLILLAQMTPGRRTFVWVRLERVRNNSVPRDSDLIWGMAWILRFFLKFSK